MAVGDTLAIFMPTDNRPPASNAATPDVRDLVDLLDFDTTTQEEAYFVGVMPKHYAGGKVKVEIDFMMTSATSGTVAWDVAFERRSEGDAHDHDTSSFDTATSIAAVTVPNTAGRVKRSSVDVAVADLDGIAAGECFRMRIRRDVANDNAAGDAELMAVHLSETS